MRMPQDVASLIEGDLSIWKALAMSPGTGLSKWYDVLTSMKRWPAGGCKKEFNQSPSARKLTDAKSPYFAFRNELEVMFQIIRSAYSHESVVATEQDLVTLSEVYFRAAARNVTELSR